MRCGDGVGWGWRCGNRGCGGVVCVEMGWGKGGGAEMGLGGWWRCGNRGCGGGGGGVRVEVWR